MDGLWLKHILKYTSEAVWIKLINQLKQTQCKQINFEIAKYSLENTGFGCTHPFGTGEWVTAPNSSVFIMFMMKSQRKRLES